MRFKKLRSLGLLAFMFTAFSAFAEEIPNPCVGILNLASRPTVADAVCVVPFEKGVVEMGAQYQNLPSSKRGYNLPQFLLRLGLPANTELDIHAPNYTWQTLRPHAGWGATTVGLKHQLGYNQKWLGSVEGFLTLPTGSNAFGSDGLGGTVNGLVEYEINPAWALTFMLGWSTQTEPFSSGGQRYNSVNPDLVLSWQPKEKIEYVAEVYGQSKTAPRSGAGFNADVGVLYAWTPNLETDLEVGQRISGQLGGFNNYIGAGLAWFF